MADLVVRGTVRTESGEALVGAQVHLSTEGPPVRSTLSGSDGSFTVAAPSAAGYLVTILDQGREAWRRRLGGAAGPSVDLGTIQLAATEMPPGIAGQAWDEERNAPVTGGRATLQRDGRVVGEDAIDSGGAFFLELSATRLLPPGSYTLTLQAPGYRDRDVPVQVEEDLTSYLLGRLELLPAAPS